MRPSPAVIAVICACAGCAPDTGDDPGRWGEAGSWDGSGGSDVVIEPVAEEPEHCFNGADDDGDGAADCADTDCTYDHACSPCHVTVSGTCGTNWNVWSQSSRQQVSGYACDGGTANTPEVVFEFLSLEDRAVTVSVTPEAPQFGFGGNDVSLYLLESVCHPDTCLDHASTAGLGGLESLSFDAVGGVYYYFSIEDVGGTDTEFDVALFCG